MRLRTLIIPLLAVGALVVAGCGSSNNPSDSSVAHIGQAKTTTTASDPGGLLGGGVASQYERLVRYTECLRAHGEPNVPDPTHTGDSVGLNLGSVDHNSPQFQAAERACSKYAPPGIAAGGNPAKIRAELDAFAACMRSHGLPNYPDPKFSSSSSANGQNKVSVQVGGPGINRNTPQYASALSACRSQLPGGSK